MLNISQNQQQKNDSAQFFCAEDPYSQKKCNVDKQNDANISIEENKNNITFSSGNILQQSKSKLSIKFDKIKFSDLLNESQDNYGVKPVSVKQNGQQPFEKTQKEVESLVESINKQSRTGQNSVRNDQLSNRSNSQNGKKKYAEPQIGLKKLNVFITPNKALQQSIKAVKRVQNSSPISPQAANTFSNDDNSSFNQKNQTDNNIADLIYQQSNQFQDLYKFTQSWQSIFNSFKEEVQIELQKKNSFDFLEFQAKTEQKFNYLEMFEEQVNDKFSKLFKNNSELISTNIKGIQKPNPNIGFNQGRLSSGLLNKSSLVSRIEHIENQVQHMQYGNQKSIPDFLLNSNKSLDSKLRRKLSEKKKYKEDNKNNYSSFGELVQTQIDNSTSINQNLEAKVINIDKRLQILENEKDQQKRYNLDQFHNIKLEIFNRPTFENLNKLELQIQSFLKESLDYSNERQKKNVLNDSRRSEILNNSKRFEKQVFEEKSLPQKMSKFINKDQGIKAIRLQQKPNFQGAFDDNVLKPQKLESSPIVDQIQEIRDFRNKSQLDQNYSNTSFDMIVEQKLINNEIEQNNSQSVQIGSGLQIINKKKLEIFKNQQQSSAFNKYIHEQNDNDEIPIQKVKKYLPMIPDFNKQIQQVNLNFDLKEGFLLTQQQHESFPVSSRNLQKIQQNELKTSQNSHVKDSFLNQSEQFLEPQNILNQKKLQKSVSDRGNNFTSLRIKEYQKQMIQINQIKKTINKQLQYNQEINNQSNQEIQKGMTPQNQSARTFRSIQIKENQEEKLDKEYIKQIKSARHINNKNVNYVNENNPKLQNESKVINDSFSSFQRKQSNDINYFNEKVQKNNNNGSNKFILSFKK